MKSIINIITIVLVILGVFCFVILGLAGQKYNPFTNKWETVPEDAEIRYDPFNNTWHFHDPDAEQEYNPFSNQWQWDDGINPSDDCDLD